MSPSSSPDQSGPLPDWALGQAMIGQDDEDIVGRDDRARQLVQEFADERHDEDDDPDQGGEG